MTFVGLLFVAVLIGIQAQKIKGRTGAAWGFIALVLGLLWWAIVAFALRVNPGSVADVDETSLEITKLLFVNGPVLVLMGIIVATLPKKGKAATPTG